MLFYFIYEILLKKYNIKFPSECINKTNSTNNNKSNLNEISLNEIITIDTNNILVYSMKKKNNLLWSTKLEPINEQLENIKYNEIDLIV